MRRSLETLLISVLFVSALTAVEETASAQPVDPVVEMRDHFDKGQPFYEVRKYETTTPGAFIYLDDTKSDPLGQGPWNGPIEGSHKLIISAPGFKNVETDVTGDAKRITIVKVVMSERGTLAWLEVSSNVAAAD